MDSLEVFEEIKIEGNSPAPVPRPRSPQNIASSNNEENKVDFEEILPQIENLLNGQGIPIMPNVVDNIRDQDFNNNPGAYYDYYQAERREKERRFFLSFGIVRFLYEALYLCPILILYGQEMNKTCGTSMNAIIAAEILTKLVFFNLIRFTLLILAKSSERFMWGYRLFVFIRFFMVLIWNIVVIVLFSVSTNDCIDGATFLWVASLLILIQAIAELTLKSCLIFCIITAVAVGRRDPELQRMRQMQMDRKLIVEIITKVKNLRLRAEEFIPNEDTCCICLEKFQKNEEVTYLPCNKKHMFHYKCISEWLSNQARCPICKEMLSRKSITDALCSQKS